MSRNPDDYTDTRRTAVALERIADALDDFMEMSLSAQALTTSLQATDPATAELLAPLTEAMRAIRERRANR